MCNSCVQSVKLKLLFAIKRRWHRSEPAIPSRTFNRVSQARELLADLRRKL
jgi:hypothetical protein